MRGLFLLGCLSALLMAPCGVAAQQSDTTATAVYVLSEGDTFYGLAARLGMDVDSLVQMNAFRAGVLRPGDRIRIPIRKTSRPYVVRSGDTLAKLSRDFGVSVEAIRQANGMRGSTIQIGQRLMIPGQGVRGQVPVEEINQASVAEWTAVAYPDIQTDRMLASGWTYDPDAYSISHPAYKTGTVVMVRSLETGASTFAVVRDRARSTGRALIDVSHAVARQLGFDSRRSARIEIRLIDDGS